MSIKCRFVIFDSRDEGREIVNARMDMDDQEAVETFRRSIDRIRKDLKSQKSRIRIQISELEEEYQEGGL